MTEKIRRTCCVCGFTIPTSVSIEYLIQKGAATIKGDGSVIVYCTYHTPEEIRLSQSGVPKFKRAGEL